ncbi:hypothetical protein COLO4_13256 [Corchorus olitorius]|uniref:AAA+ ATPase domain-containing protein n=1 Tax=Corchorus olitorius TaxID=93759 RepID=A0A1R3JX82_9ROSI|nr:hypothetical protein COLO4_13256 [Corchorus olitorius]
MALYCLGQVGSSCRKVKGIRESNRDTVSEPQRRKNNPCLIGDPGVGKTAIVEGLAQNIMKPTIPPKLQGNKIFAIDMGRLIAGTSNQGEIEERLIMVMEEVKQSERAIILFLDEIHILTGGQAFDAANILKPALARGEFQCIGATTPDEYRKYIEKDAGLKKLFQVVEVGFLPDKAIDLLDKAGARLQLLQDQKTPQEFLLTEDNIRETVAFITGITMEEEYLDLENDTSQFSAESLEDSPKLLKLENEISAECLEDSLKLLSLENDDGTQMPASATSHRSPGRERPKREKRPPTWFKDSVVG